MSRQTLPIASPDRWVIVCDKLPGWITIFWQWWFQSFLYRRLELCCGSRERHQIRPLIGVIRNRGYNVFAIVKYTIVFPPFECAEADPLFGPGLEADNADYIEAVAPVSNLRMFIASFLNVSDIKILSTATRITGLRADRVHVINGIVVRVLVE